jgi:hypothetical protein
MPYDVPITDALEQALDRVETLLAWAASGPELGDNARRELEDLLRHVQATVRGRILESGLDDATIGLLTIEELASALGYKDRWALRRAVENGSESHPTAPVARSEGSNRDLFVPPRRRATPKLPARRRLDG